MTPVPASVMFRRLWTYGYVAVLEELCWAGAFLLGMWFTSRRMSVFRGLKGGIDLGRSATKSECSHLRSRRFMLDMTIKKLRVFEFLLLFFKKSDTFNIGKIYM